MFSVKIHRCFQVDIIVTPMATADVNIDISYRCSFLVAINLTGNKEGTIVTGTGNISFYSD